MNNETKNTIIKGIFSVIVALISVGGVVLIRNLRVTVEGSINIDGPISINNPIVGFTDPESGSDQEENSAVLTESLITGNRRYKDAIPETYIESLILEGYYRKLARGELTGFSDADLERVINGMSAMSGKIFETKENIAYFTSRTWYSPNKSYSSSKSLNEFQQANRDLCVKIQKENGWRK